MTTCVLMVLLLPLCAGRLNLNAQPLSPSPLQGGMYIFDGPTCVFSHKDKATGAHADFGEVLGIAQRLAGPQDCGCGEGQQQQQQPGAQ